MDKILRFKLLLFFLLCSTAAFAQTMYHDAIRLKQYGKEVAGRIAFDPEEKEAVAILLKYTNGTVATDRQLINELSDNPFISAEGGASLAEGDENLLAAVVVWVVWM
jgi:hypothetical protein